MFRKGRVALEVTSEGVYATIGSKEERYLVFPSLEEALGELPKFSEVRASIARDVFFLRKMKLPPEALEHLKENPSYIAEELFPDDSLEVYTYVASEEGEVIFFGIPKDILQTLKKNKKVSFLTLSSFLYLLEVKDFSFARVLRKISEKYYELCTFKEGKLLDSFLLSPKDAERKKKEVDLLIEDHLTPVRLLREVKPEDIPFFLHKKESEGRYEKILAGINLILAPFLIYSLISYDRRLSALEEIRAQLSMLQERVDEYYTLVSENEKLKKLINTLKTLKSRSLYFLWRISRLLPSDAVLRAYVYENNGRITLEGEALSASRVIDALVRSRLFKEVKVELIQKSGDKEIFRIKLFF